MWVERSFSSPIRFAHLVFFFFCFVAVATMTFHLACNFQRMLPNDLQSRIRSYYYHLWQRKGAFEGPELLRDLPCNLRQRVHSCTYGQILRKVPIFEHCHDDFISAITEHLKPRIYAPGDTVVQYGEEGDEMFFLNQVTRPLGVVQSLDGANHPKREEGEEKRTRIKNGWLGFTHCEETRKGIWGSRWDIKRGEVNNLVT